MDNCILYNNNLVLKQSNTYVLIPLPLGGSTATLLVHCLRVLSYRHASQPQLTLVGV